MTISLLLLTAAAVGADVLCADPFGGECVSKKIDCKGGALKCHGRGVCKGASITNCHTITCEGEDACSGISVTNARIRCVPAPYQCDISETESYACKNAMLDQAPLNDKPRVDCVIKWKSIGVKFLTPFRFFSHKDMNIFVGLLEKSLQQTTALVTSYICPLSSSKEKPTGQAANDSCRQPHQLQERVITSTTTATGEVYNSSNGMFLELILTREGHSFELEYNALLEGLRELSMGKGPMSTDGMKDLDPYCDGEYMKTTQEGVQWSVRAAANWKEPAPSRPSDLRPGLLAIVLVLSAGFLAVSSFTLNIVVKGRPKRNFHQAPQVNMCELLDRDPSCLEHMETAEMELQAYYGQQQPNTHSSSGPGWRSPARSRSSMSRSSSGSSEGRKGYRPVPPAARFSPLAC